MATDKLPDEDIQRALTEVVNHFDKEDRPVRERQIREWKRLKYLWDGIENIYWSEVARNWQTWPFSDVQGNAEAGVSDAYYDKPLNVFKAYLEAIIAALSVTIPAIKCFPDDADNSLDIATAKAGDKISKLVISHQNFTLTWLHALYIFCTEGLIASYNYSKEDKSYGTYKKNKYDEKEVEQDVKGYPDICPLCQANLVDENLVEKQENKFEPNDADSETNSLLNENEVMCPQCMGIINANIRKEKVFIRRLIGETEEPKSRICVEVHGGLFVKVPVYAQKQEDIPYLIYSYETNFVNVLERFPHLKDKITNGQGSYRSGSYDPYERWARLPVQYRGDYPMDTPTCRNAWLRPCAFNVLSDDKLIERLKKEYPDGAKVILVNDAFAKVCNESLDDHWTLSYNPLSDCLHFQPLGATLVNPQEILTEGISLVLQTVEHGVAQTFFDPQVLDADQYKNSEVVVGGMYPTKPVSGKKIAEGFHTLKTANLSGEVLPFLEKIQELAQLASGSMPTLFGAQAAGSSKTVGVYSMSRAQSLQRLNTTWKMLLAWQKDTFAKVIPAYMEDIVEDERHVERLKDGSFVNVFIRRAELEGKIGKIELEATEHLPVNWAQKKEAVMQLLQAGNPMVMQMLSAPENIQIISEIIGLDDLKVPGEEDRQKQYDEIRLLSQSEPIIMPAGMGPQGPMQEQEIPSVDVDPLLDNNAIHAEICKNYLLGDAGRQLKMDNPPGYRNILLHLQRHINLQQAQFMEQQSQGQSQRPGEDAENDNNEDGGRGNTKPRPAAQAVKKNVTSE